ncbi:helix-turn-helix domain-containing protein [Streptomyces sp. NPDC021224]|uniref:helix-turn-helix domain-containing protein n=1 Tax=unclassified Streptomyces TaxID=2593676 RepID=UPI0037B1963A
MTQARGGPTVNRRNLGAELRRLRVTAGLKGEQVAAHLGCSATRVSRIESGHRGAAAKPDEVRAMCELYGLGDERKVELLLDMLSNSQKIGWWEAYDDVLPPGYEVFVGLETDALVKRAWEPLLVHGLLQTADYARAILHGWASHRPGDIEALVEVRAKRQDVLFRDGSPLELWCILDEGAVRRPIGSGPIMKDQLNHLIELAELPNINILVVPRDRGAHPGLGGSFSIMEFENDGDGPIVYVESLAGNLHLEKKPEVRRFTGMFQLLGAMALAPDESTALLKSVAKE